METWRGKREKERERERERSIRRWCREVYEKKNGRREEGGSVGQNGTKKKRTESWLDHRPARGVRSCSTWPRDWISPTLATFVSPFVRLVLILPSRPRKTTAAFSRSLSSHHTAAPSPSRYSCSSSSSSSSSLSSSSSSSDASSQHPLLLPFSVSFYLSLCSLLFLVLSSSTCRDFVE